MLDGKNSITEKFNNLISGTKNQNPVNSSSSNSTQVFNNLNNKNAVKIEFANIASMHIASNPPQVIQTSEAETETEWMDLNELMEDRVEEHAFVEAEADEANDKYKKIYEKSYENFDVVQELTDSERNNFVKDMNFTNKLNQKLQNIELILDNFDKQNSNSIIKSNGNPNNINKNENENNSNSLNNENDDFHTAVQEKDNQNNENDLEKRYIEEKFIYNVNKTNDNDKVNSRPVNGLHIGNDNIYASYGDIIDENLRPNYEFGIVNVFDINLNNKPKSQLYSNCGVSCIAVDPTDSNLVFGGLTNGQIVKWDLREKKYPVQVTKLNEPKHVYAIKNVEIAKFQNQNYIVSSGIDGRICQFNMKDLRFIFSPELQGSENTYLNSTSFALPKTEMNYYAVGSIWGSVIIGEWHNKQNNRVIQTKELKEHLGTVTNVDYHSALSKNQDDDVNYVLLSSGSDGTVKIWNQNWSTNCLLNFESSDEFMSYCRWNPHNNCMFASGDAKGMAHFYNLEYSLESAQYKEQVTVGNNAITKLDYGIHGNGLFGVGDFGGQVYLCKTSKESSTSDSKHEDKFKQTMRFLKEEMLLLKEFNNI